METSGEKLRQAKLLEREKVGERGKGWELSKLSHLISPSSSLLFFFSYFSFLSFSETSLTSLFSFLLFSSVLVFCFIFFLPSFLCSSFLSYSILFFSLLFSFSFFFPSLPSSASWDGLGPSPEAQGSGLLCLPARLVVHGDSAGSGVLLQIVPNGGKAKTGRKELFSQKKAHAVRNGVQQNERERERERESQQRARKECVLRRVDMDRVKRQDNRRENGERGRGEGEKGGSRRVKENQGESRRIKKKKREKEREGEREEEEEESKKAKREHEEFSSRISQRHPRWEKEKRRPEGPKAQRPWLAPGCHTQELLRAEGIP